MFKKDKDFDNLQTAVLYLLCLAMVAVVMTFLLIRNQPIDHSNLNACEPPSCEFHATAVKG